MIIERYLILGWAFSVSTFELCAQQYLLSTLAGSGTIGSRDGPALTAQFYYPFQACVDPAGNLYVSDTFNNVIRKVTPAGIVTTLAGLAGSQGNMDGQGSTARFYHPDGIVATKAGDLYVSDAANYTIRKVTQDGVVSTFVGKAGASGSVDGIGSEARLSGGELNSDSEGNLYLVDVDNRRIRKVTMSSVMTTIAGPAGFYDPRGIALASDGTIYVADGGGHTIQKVTSDGTITIFAGKASTPGSQDGVGTAARFSNPQGIAIDDLGNLFVANLGNNTIRKITPTGVVTTIAGIADGTYGYVDGVGSVARFNAPYGVAVDQRGNLYVADTKNNVIRKGTPIPPSMQIYPARSKLAVAWPLWASNFVLEGNVNLSVAVGLNNSWLGITNGIFSDTNSSNFIYSFPATNSAQIFRLRNQ